MSYDKDRAYACVARVKPNKYIMIQNRTLSSRLMSQMTLVNDLMRLVYPVVDTLMTLPRLVSNYQLNSHVIG